MPGDSTPKPTVCRPTPAMARSATRRPAMSNATTCAGPAAASETSTESGPVAGFGNAPPIANTGVAGDSTPTVTNRREPAASASAYV